MSWKPALLLLLLQRRLVALHLIMLAPLASLFLARAREHELGRETRPQGWQSHSTTQSLPECQSSTLRQPLALQLVLAGSALLCHAYRLKQ